MEGRLVLADGSVNPGRAFGWDRAVAGGRGGIGVPTHQLSRRACVPGRCLTMRNGLVVPGTLACNERSSFIPD